MERSLRPCQPRSPDRGTRGPPTGVPGISPTDASKPLWNRGVGHTRRVSSPSPNPPQTGDDTLVALGEAGAAERRPWGAFVVLDDGPAAKVKRITVLPGQRLSYQLHHQRAEIWTVVDGTATVTLDGDDHTVQPGEVIAIPTGTAHRVRNDGDAPLVFIEVQTGAYFGEDDIVRLEDDYGRADG